MTFPISEAIKSNRMRKRLERLEAKLDAVKTWFSEYRFNPSSFKCWKELEKILEEK